MRVRVGLLLVTLCLTAGRASAAVTVRSLLAEMVDRDAVARWPDPAFAVRQASSYDRARVAPDKPGWFANHDNSNYVRTETHAGRTERVMMDADGPGAVVRFFLTSGGPRDARIRVYLDGADAAAVEWPTFDLLGGDLGVGAPLALRHPPPLGHGGSTLYLPVPYAKHCKVTVEEADPAHADARYYHVDYRTYAAGTAVETFTREALAAARADVDRVNALLSDPPEPATAGTAGFGTTLVAGGEAAVDLPAGPAAVRRVELSVGAGLPPAAREQALRSVVVRGTFDDDADAIWCPAGDFAGSGAGGRPLAGWARTVDDAGTAVCRWTMPYRGRGRLSVLNLGDAPVHVRLMAGTGPWAWDGRSMHFHATWHQQVGIPARPFRDWNFVTVTGGRGALVGDVMSVFNPIPSWYGEGDEKVWVDGEPFPSHVGTGTEDYYNASWAPNPVYQTPFASHPRMDDPDSAGQNVYTRSRCLDAIPFARDLRFDFEVETWKDTRVDYAATTYWYGSPGAHATPTPDPAEARRPVPALPPAWVIDGAVECESAAVRTVPRGLVAERQDMRPFAGQWSGHAQLLVRGTGPGQSVELDIPAAGTAPRRVTLFATRARDYGVLKLSVNGHPVAHVFDGYAADPTPSGPIPLGVFAPVDGRLVLRAELVGTNPKTDGRRYLAGLDAVVVSER